MTKVLHIVADMGQGGAQSYVLDLIKTLEQKSSVENELVALFSKGALWDELNRLGINNFCLDMRGAKDIVRFLKLIDILRANRYDVIHVHAIFPLIGLVLYFFSYHSCRVYTEHAGGLLKGQILPRLVYWFFPWCYHRFIVISGFMLTIMRRINPFINAEKFVVIHNGSDIDDIEKQPSYTRSTFADPFLNRTFCIGIVARLEEQKGVFNFLDAVHKIVQVRTDVSFVVVGEGTQSEDLQRYVKQLKLESFVFFMGFRKDAVAIMKCFDIFLFTSNQESFGLVLTEAMAAGVPIVALDIESAVTEIIDDGVNGYIVKGKSYDQLVEKINILLDQPELRRQFIDNAKQKVRQCFSMQANADAVKKLYLQHLVSK